MNRPRCYAVRRVNPPRGVVQVLELEQGRALSTDGLNWQLQVLAERPEHTWASRNQGKSRHQYFRAGLWSAAEGVSRVPVNPLLDIKGVLAGSEALIEALRTLDTPPPFPLGDHYERWLLDAEGDPVALLASAIKPRTLAHIEVTAWSAAPDYDQAFRARCLEELGLADEADGNPRLSIDYLERQVNQAGSTVGCFLRQSDGDRLPLSETGERLEGLPSVPAARFPDEGLRREWADPVADQLVAEYLQWIAPWLLSLPGLEHDRRAELEQHARQRAELLSNQYLLYPVILQPDLVDAARVESRLRGSVNDLPDGD